MIACIPPPKKKYDMTTLDGIMLALLQPIFLIKVKGIILSATQLSTNTLFTGTPLKVVIIYRGLRWKLIAIVGLENIKPNYWLTT